MHIISGDRWAGAEIQAYTLLSQLKSKASLKVILMNEGELATRLHEQNIPVTIIDESTTGSLSIFRMLLREIRAFKPDVIHTHRQKENILGSIASLLTGVGTGVRTVHGAPEITPNGRKKILNWIDIFTGKHLQKAVISVSQDLSTKLTHIYKANRIHTITNGIDVDRVRDNISEADFKKQRPDHIHAGLVGRLDQVKRIDIFLQMAAAICADPGDKLWHFHIFGEGSLANSLQEQALQLGITPSVTFHGHRLDIQNCVAALDVMVMTSDHEGLPMAALESIALNTPLVAHKVGGLTEVLSDYPALLVADHSPEGYQKAVVTALQMHNTELKLQPKFSAAENANGTLALYQRLVSR